MKKPKTLAAFTAAQKSDLHRRLAGQVASMMGRKLEEDDWATAYCAAKAIPKSDWSNLSIDVNWDGLGVEHKMLRAAADKELRDYCGTRLMHPSATRSIRIPPGDDPNVVMQDVLGQYADLITARSKDVAKSSPDGKSDMRTGWLLWQSSLVEFLYFEEEMLAPDPAEFFAEWRESHGGSRKASRNLWVFEKSSRQKRFSITTGAGPKIQPYFDVPPPNDPNLYFFRVQGEKLTDGYVRVWVLESTARELERLAGDLTPSNIGLSIDSAAAGSERDAGGRAYTQELAVAIELREDSYMTLSTSFAGVSDQHMVQLLVQRLGAK